MLNHKITNHQFHKITIKYLILSSPLTLNLQLRSYQYLIFLVHGLGQRLSEPIENKQLEALA